MKDKHKKARPAPLSLRLSSEERASLERAAGGMPLGTHIKSILFDGAAQRVHRPSPVRDERTMAQILARLGGSGLAAHMNALVDAARSGSLACDDEIAALLRAACADIATMRSMLVAALGLKTSRHDTGQRSSTPCRAFDALAGQGGGR